MRRVRSAGRVSLWRARLRARGRARGRVRVRVRVRLRVVVRVRCAGHDLAHLS